MAGAPSGKASARQRREREIKFRPKRDEINKSKKQKR